MKASTVEEEGMTRKFWIKFENDYIFTMYAPFFVSLAAGNLRADAFLHCIAHDSHYLRAFSRAYELAEECADDEDDKAAIRKLRKRVKQKLKGLDSLVREWGFELPEESIIIDAAAVKYTDFLAATSLGRVEGERVLKIETPFEKIKVAAYIISAISPSMRIFAAITQKIQNLLDPNDSNHIYKKWIDYYSSQEFEVAALQTEELLDKLSVSLTGEELEVIEKLYHQSMKLLAAYFSAQPIEQQVIVPLSRVQDALAGHLTIFCDFDLTCAAFDSSAILAEVAILTAKKVDPDQSETKLIRMSSADLRSAWDTLSALYSEEYEQCIESIMSREAGTFDYGSLCEALKQFADFEKTANSRVVASGVLEGLHLEDIKRTGEHLILQDGCRGFFQKTLERENFKTDVHILSYCWCGDLIRSTFSSGDLNSLRVHSNELVYEEAISTGEIVKKTESPMEKLQIFNDILKYRNSDDQHLTVYIGGSLGDLLCLLEADIGIVMGSSSSLRRVGEQYGVSFVPLFSGLVDKQKKLAEDGSCKWNKLAGTLYTVSSWAEIHAFVLGL